jgi:excisionase family DNA binding protein
LATSLAHEYLTTEQIAEICHVSPKTVRTWLHDGLLPSVRLPGSRRRLIPRAALDELLAAA